MKTIVIDMQCEKSIRNAEKEKARMENAGYELIHTMCDLRFATLVYEK